MAVWIQCKYNLRTLQSNHGFRGMRSKNQQRQLNRERKKKSYLDYQLAKFYLRLQGYRWL